MLGRTWLAILLLHQTAWAGCFRAHPEPAETNNLLLLLALFLLVGPLSGCAAGQWTYRKRRGRIRPDRLARSFFLGLAATIGSGVVLLTIGPVAVVAPVIGGAVAFWLTLASPDL